jgi:hypothetical protein
MSQSGVEGGMLNQQPGVGALNSAAAQPGELPLVIRDAMLLKCVIPVLTASLPYGLFLVGRDSSGWVRHSCPKRSSGYQIWSNGTEMLLCSLTDTNSMTCSRPRMWAVSCLPRHIQSECNAGFQMAMALHLKALMSATILARVLAMLRDEYKNPLMPML